MQKNKQHNLAKLLTSVKGYSDEFTRIFPQQTKEDIDALVPIVERLAALAKTLYEEKIKTYAALREEDLLKKTNNKKGETMLLLFLSKAYRTAKSQ